MQLACWLPDSCLLLHPKFKQYTNVHVSVVQSFWTPSVRWNFADPTRAVSRIQLIGEARVSLVQEPYRKQHFHQHHQLELPGKLLLEVFSCKEDVHTTSGAGAAPDGQRGACPGNSPHCSGCAEYHACRDERLHASPATAPSRSECASHRVRGRPCKWMRFFITLSCDRNQTCKVVCALQKIFAECASFTCIFHGLCETTERQARRQNTSGQSSA